MDREFCIECIINSRALIPELSEKIIADLGKLDKIEQIVNNYDGSIPSMITQFSEIQKVLEENN